MITFDRDGRRFTYRVAGVAVHEGRVLLHRDHAEDFWVLPGGRVEMGEIGSQALAREMREELGVDVTIDRLLWSVENLFHYNGAECHELGLYYAMSIPGEACVYDRSAPYVLTEGSLRLEFEWLDLATLPDLPLYPSFLRTRLAALPEAAEHVVHDERGEGKG